jgi:hypothetical protein
MPNLLGSVFKQPCSHEFSWPRPRLEGGYYQVCVRCGGQYAYDWATMVRGEKIAAFARLQSQTDAPKPSGWVPRAPRITVRKVVFYRQIGHSQYLLATLQNISESGVLLECQANAPEGAT